MRATICSFCAACFIAMATPAKAEPPWVNDNDTRYMALGDSLTAGFGAQPATQGFVYLLYQRGVFDKTPNTLFANIGVPGAISQDVFNFQVPQVALFQPHVITLTVGGNDLLAVLDPTLPPDPGVIIGIINNYALNLGNILLQLCGAVPAPQIIVGNVYAIPQISEVIPGADLAIGALNSAIEQTVDFVTMVSTCDVRIADVFNAFGGFEGRSGLLLIDRNGAGQFEVHPTNAGYRVMANAFEQAFLATPE